MNSMTKQTAVEWLVNQLIFKQEYEHLPNNYFLMSDKDIDSIIQQAKEMEKEQIIDANIEGQRVFDKHPHTQWTNDQAEQYYNENYGGSNNE